MVRDLQSTLAQLTYGPGALSAALHRHFVPLSHDDATERFLTRTLSLYGACSLSNSLFSGLRSLLGNFMSHANVLALLNTGRMHVLSAGQMHHLLAQSYARAPLDVATLNPEQALARARATTFASFNPVLSASTGALAGPRGNSTSSNSNSNSSSSLSGANSAAAGPGLGEWAAPPPSLGSIIAAMPPLDGVSVSPADDSTPPAETVGMTAPAPVASAPMTAADYVTAALAAVGPAVDTDELLEHAQQQHQQQRNTANGSASASEDSLSLPCFGSYLDIGAGDGAVTAHVAPLFTHTSATEVAPRMCSRLRAHGFTVYETYDITTGIPAEARFDTISIFNVIDRCDKPLSLLRDARARLRGPDSRLVLSVPLPLQPSVEFAPREWRAPTERIAPAMCYCQLDWEQAVEFLVRDVVTPAGLRVRAVSRLPYLSEGSTARPYYALDDAVLVLSAAETVPAATATAPATAPATTATAAAVDRKSVV